MQNISPGRNDPCWCGSTLKYKHCHLELDSAEGPARVGVSRQVYLRGWSRNAENLAQQGAYDWMASQLQAHAPKRILDIGAGDGQGIAALWRSLHPDLILSIDENCRCLAATQGRLNRMGIASSVVQRLSVDIKSEEFYSLAIEQGKLTRRDGILLVESELLADAELEQFLETSPPFDAVTVWLIGTHPMRHQCLSVVQFHMRDNADYRLRVQNKAYQLADRILRPGGLLHIVDRGEAPDTKCFYDELVEGHKEQAATTRLQVQPPEFILYRESKEAHRVQMVASSGKGFETERLAVISVLAIKGPR